MRYTVNNIGPTYTGVDSFNNSSTTLYLREVKDEVYIVHKPGGQPKPGDVIDGSINPDKNGRLRLKKTPMQPQSQGQQQTYTPSPSGPARPSGQTMKADPAKSESIENQSYYKQAVDLLRIDAEINTDKYAGKSLRELNDMVISEAKHAKDEMRRPDAVQQLMDNVDEFGNKRLPNEPSTEYPPLDAIPKEFTDSELGL